jgi:hypothetical protein
MTHLAIAFAACASCSAPAQTEASEDLAAIVGGQATPSCAWPTTVHFQQISGRGGASSACTATLIHPRVVSIAAHCVEGTGAREIAFGDTNDHVRGAARRVSIQSCTQRPNWQSANEDFAFCILSQDVNDVPIIPVLFGCEEQILRTGTPVVLVGYGNVDEQTPSPQGHKRAVDTTVDTLARDRRTIDLGDATHTQCFGDAGGPAFVKLADGSWRMFGAASTTAVVGGASCRSAGTWAYVPNYVAWAEQASGIDLTPCYDAATRRWSPGPSCAGVPMNPEVSDGTWAQMCTENLVLSGPVATCGAATDAGAASPDASADSSHGGFSADASGGSAGTGGDDTGAGGAAGGGPVGSGGYPSGTGGSDGTAGGPAGASGSVFRPIRSSNLNQVGSCTCGLVPGGGPGARASLVAFGVLGAAWLGAGARTSSRRRRAGRCSRPCR